MSSPSGTVDPGAVKPVRVAALAGGDVLVDTGEPIDDLPPLIEPVLWEVPGPRPPRQRFLAAPAEVAEAVPAAAFDVPTLVEPEAAPEDAPPVAREPPRAPAATLPVEDQVASAPAVETPTERAESSEADAAVVPEHPAAALRQDTPSAPVAASPVGDTVARPRPAPAVEAPTAPDKPAAAPSAKAPAIAARLAGWSARGRRLVAATPRWQLAVAAGVVVALCALVVVMAAGIRLFTHARSYPTADAPSDPAARLAYFQEGADAGDANAELQLGILYAKGEGVTQDYETAGKWFRAAANQSVARAQYDLGVLYERGRGVPLDLTEAANWYLKGAQGGHPLAQYNLAVCYIKGQGIRQDAAEGALWYRRAATQGVVQAMINLAIMYEKGEGVAASPVDAYAWFLAAGRRDNQTAAQHAEDLFATLAKNDQIRAQALASDVAASIHVPENSDKPVAAATGGGH